MPFGSFKAQRRDPSLRKEKKQALQDSPGEMKMDLHEFDSDGLQIKILLTGRTMPAIQDFLCSIRENMSKELHREGLAYYTTDLRSISDVVARKKALERFFWEFSQKDWSDADASEKNRVYSFSISPSGMQETTLDLIFYCAAFDSQSEISQDQADAVWYLADGPVLDADIGYDDYRVYLAEALGSLKASRDDMDKPVCLLLSQIEKLGHFGGAGDISVLKEPVSRKLLDRCREIFCCDEAVNVAVIPVQIYGGLEYVGTDPECNPILRLSESGYYQSYIPENCQVPVLYSVGKIAKLREADFFAGTPCGGVNKVIHRHFARKKGRIDWKPDVLREVTEA